MADERKSISLGFVGAPPMTLKLIPADVDKLVAAVKAGDQWIEVADEKRTVTLRADLVLAYSLDPEEKDERRAGF